MTEELKIIISAQYAELKKGCEEAKNSVQGMAKQNENTLNKFKDTVKKIATTIGSYLAFKEIVSFGKNCIEAAAEAQAASSQFTQVFDNLESSAQKSLSSIAKETGIVENRMKGSYTQIAAFAKTTGMDTAESLELTNRAMVAVADSAAFYDRSLEDTTESLQSFLKGNYENDAALGLSCTETTRNAKANELYGKSFKDLSESQKQLTLLAMVEDANKLSGALGQAARESDTWTNQTGNLKQAWTDFQAVIGSDILPIAIDALTKMAEVVESCKEKYAELKKWISENQTALEFIAIAVGTVTAAIAAYTIAQNAATIVIGIWTAAQAVATAAGTAFGAVMAFITSPITLVVVAIGALIAIIVLCVKHWDEIKEVVIKVWDKIKSTVQAGVDAVVGFFEKVINWIKENWQGLLLILVNPIAGAFKLVYDNCEGFRNKVDTFVGKVKEIFSTGFNAAKNTVVNIFNSIKDKISNILEGAKNIVKNVIDKIKSFFKFEWSLPKLKMPHVKISGSFSLAPPQVPKFSIDWYAKGGVFDTPTLFGYGSAIGGLGEAGAEAVVPLEKNTGWMDKIAERIGNKIGNTPVVLQVDGKTFATTSISCINDYTRQTGHLALNIF